MKPSAPGAGHALAVLEFDRVLAGVAKRATGPAGAARILASRPLPDAASAAASLAAVEAVRGLLAGSDPWQLGPIPDIGPALGRLRIADAPLDADVLRDCATVMRTGRSAATRLADHRAEGPLSRHVDALWGDAALADRIETSFEPSGEVSDRASPELRRIRRALVDRRSRLVDRLESYARGLPDRVQVPDASVTVRNGRYCIPVRREGKSQVGGLVHDASASHQTLFVEPPMAIDEMNEIRELEVAEVREISRILSALTDGLRAHRTELARSFEALAALDSIRARARYALETDGVAPAFGGGQDGRIAIRNGRHPLLADTKSGAVPFDLDLAADERVLLVSGPNAGGKTVLLKSIGLLAALAQSGIVPPVGPGTRLPFFRGFFAVIGDEQSIDASLSTFGAQARNLSEILNGAGPEDLVLIDEIGSATDPAEGGALAAATLARLATQARLTVATTHLGDLKRLADEDAATVNASLQFDAGKLEPTYRLVRDRPGRSYALEIASRLGVPDEVLEDARARLDVDHRSLDALLERLDAERAEAEALRADLERRVAVVEAREQALGEREAELDDAERAARKEREEARAALLMEARTLVEEKIAELDARFEAADREGRADASREARRAVEAGIREAREAAREADTASREALPGGDDPGPGDRVAWHGSNRDGVLVEVRGDRAVVEVDGIRLTVPRTDLELVDGGGRGAGTVPGGASGSRPTPGRTERRERRPEIEVRTELDLRGLRVEELDGVLIPAVDAAVVADLPWLRIIHGKGTGALRQRVQAMLDEDPRVRAHRPGAPTEGGTGVTVAEFQ